jgi:phosphomevalonate kinase
MKPSTPLPQPQTKKMLRKMQQQKQKMMQQLLLKHKSYLMVIKNKLPTTNKLKQLKLENRMLKRKLRLMEVLEMRTSKLKT